MFDCPDSQVPDSQGLLIFPHVRVQGVNATSSQLTWGFPSMTAFVGLMWNIERTLARYPEHKDLIFDSVGVVCHSFEPLVGKDRLLRHRPYRFALTRNPVKETGKPASIVEEGRAHIEITLIFGVSGAMLDDNQEERKQIAQEIFEIVSTLPLAGGTVLPRPNDSEYYHPNLITLADDPEKRAQQFRRLRHSWLPGYTLVSRHSYLKARQDEIQKSKPDATLLDALLDLSRLNYKAQPPSPADDIETEPDAQDGTQGKEVAWEQVRKHAGWLVPIPIGYARLSGPHKQKVANTRDNTTPFEFVECVYSLGEWLGPHRLTDVAHLLWYPNSDVDKGLYYCCNDYPNAQEHQLSTQNNSTNERNQ